MGSGGVGAGWGDICGWRGSWRCSTSAPLPQREARPPPTCLQSMPGSTPTRTATLEEATQVQIDGFFSQIHTNATRIE